LHVSGLPIPEHQAGIKKGRSQPLKKPACIVSNSAWKVILQVFARCPQQARLSVLNENPVCVLLK
jgi:hypothetical protein